jgi:methylmalonyl-CoA mutase
VVTAASLFDGHDAAINIMRRLLQAQGAEVIHLGHDRSVDEIAEAAVQEDAHAVAVSSYQGGHLEFFGYLLERLRALGAEQVRVFGGGGGTITSEEAAALEAKGVARIFRPEDGRALGLEGMIGSLLDACRGVPPAPRPDPALLSADDPRSLARAISWFEAAATAEVAGLEPLRRALDAQRSRPAAPVVGFTGTGGSGKSSVVDEMVRRFRLEFPRRRIGCLLVDPTRRRSGGALLGDRLRMNAIHGPGVFVRSLATRQAHLALSRSVADALRVLQAADFDLLIVETAGIGQSDSEVIDLVDLPVYEMTPEYGAPSQLEKIDMLDLAEVIVLNKADRHGADDALRDVRRQWRRNRGRPELPDAEVPVFATIARRWNDPGVDRLYRVLRERLLGAPEAPAAAATDAPGAPLAPIPAARARHLAEVAEAVRHWHARTESDAERAADAEGIARTLRTLGAASPELAQPLPEPGAPEPDPSALLRPRYAAALDALAPETRAALAGWPATRAR